jgi:lysophospholipase L1-like esterase
MKGEWIFSSFLSFVLLFQVFGTPTNSQRSREKRRHRGKMDADYEDENGTVLFKKASQYFLAFGDSLTEGYYRMGYQFHPYTEKLEELLARDGHSIGVVNRGISGETTFQMAKRLDELLKRSLKFDYVCILAGTNDLADDSESAASIFERLQKLYTTTLSAGAKLIVVTIPQAAFDRDHEDYLKKKMEINQMVRQFYEEKKSSGQVEYFDLFSTVPYYGEDGKRSSLWDDHLHLGPAGYDVFGERVYHILKGLHV